MECKKAQLLRCYPLLPQAQKAQLSKLDTHCSMSLMGLTASKRLFLREKQLPRKARRTESKPKRKVTFSSLATVQVRPITDPGDTWYQLQEYARFEGERRETINAIRSVHGDFASLDPEVHCIRGLEQQLSKKQVLSRRYKTMQFMRALLQKQFIQKQSGHSDPDSLQLMSSIFSQQACERAHFRAMLSLSFES